MGCLGRMLKGNKTLVITDIDLFPVVGFVEREGLL